MIEVKNLVKQFDGFCALDSVDMHVKKGAIYGGKRKVRVYPR